MTGALDRRDPTSTAPTPWWGFVAAASVGLAVLVVATRPFYDPQVRLSEDVRLPVVLPVLGAAAVGGIAAVAGRRSAPVGHTLVAAALGLLAATWLSLTGHRFAGPVVMELSPSHGLHLTDALAVVPLGLAVAAAVAAVDSFSRRRRRPRRPGGPGVLRRTPARPGS